MSTLRLIQRLKNFTKILITQLELSAEEITLKRNGNPNNKMKKQLLFIFMLIAGMLIAGTIDEQTRQLEQQPNHYTK
jgi:hypothetical protein